MNKLIYCCLLTMILAACGGPVANNKYLVYQNIVIVSDLSSRLDNRPSKDIDEIKTIMKYFRDDCVKPGEKIGDKSCISFSTFSDMDIARIDIDEIKNLGHKQQFINSTGEYQNCGLDKQIENFEKTVIFSYDSIRNKGLDLISGLIEKINNDGIIKEDKYLTDGVDTTFIEYANHIYIFTDGYLEFLNRQKNDQFYFGDREIRNVRQFCVNKQTDIKDALCKKPSLGLAVYKLPKSKYVNLHILETHERDKNERLQTYSNPIGLRDNEILEAVWEKWAKETGFKSFEWKKY